MSGEHHGHVTAIQHHDGQGENEINAYKLNLQHDFLCYMDSANHSERVFKSIFDAEVGNTAA